MVTKQASSGDLNNSIRNMRWDDVRRTIRSRPQLVNDKYLGVASLHTLVLAKAPQNLILEILEFAKEEVINDVNLEKAGRSILHYLAFYGYVDALRHVLENSQKRVNWQTESNVYVQNKCDEYDSTKKQKEEILQILYSVAVPREVLARGKEARVAFNKELEKSQIIPVNNSQIIAVRELKGIVKTIKLESNVMKKLNERIERVNGTISTATATAKAIHEYFLMKQKSKKKSKGNVRKKRKLSHPTSTTANVPVSSTEDAEVLKLSVKEHNTGCYYWINISKVVYLVSNLHYSSPL
ncbi:uncharacterized protein LOC117100875 [Anneissia japonica]|uniref:uncharacterized protein LOC117100875 n=1 Tax=Anneissia japonica TaxID=1529436 RepID=UPI001425723C|nr:uncharacterized protein LOC117100875 [Anneissia japonica]